MVRWSAMQKKWRISAVLMGAFAVGVVALPSFAIADPNSPFFSQQLYDQQAEQQQGPWPDSQVNVPQLTAGGGVNLGAITAGQGGVAGGGGALNQALGATLPVPTGVLGASGTGALFQGGGVGSFSPGATAASAVTSALGALGPLGH